MEIIKKCIMNLFCSSICWMKMEVEVFEDALQSLQQSILELIEAKAGILLSDDILGESYWSEFSELLTKSIQGLEEIKERNDQQRKSFFEYTVSKSNSQ